jgi:hypothetical protein
MTTLHYSIINFFESRMASHSRVERCTRLNVPDEFVYSIERKDNLGSLKVFLSDAYRFGRVDYISRPREIRRGDFILIARPEADYSDDVTERAQSDGIGIGKIGKLQRIPVIWRHILHVCNNGRIRAA